MPCASWPTKHLVPTLKTMLVRSAPVQSITSTTHHRPSITHHPPPATHHRPLAFRLRSFGSDLHTYSVALCNAIEKGAVLRTAGNFIYDDKGSCSSKQMASPLSCYFPVAACECRCGGAGEICLVIVPGSPSLALWKDPTTRDLATSRPRDLATSRPHDPATSSPACQGLGPKMPWQKELQRCPSLIQTSKQEIDFRRASEFNLKSVELNILFSPSFGIPHHHTTSPPCPLKRSF